MNILLGITGSVAATLAPKIYSELSKLGTVKVVITDSAKHFFKKPERHAYHPSGWGYLWEGVWFDHEPIIIDDEAEWKSWTHKGDAIQHIDLRKWADVMVIAPLSANTLAKIANGICDNLLTCTARAWNFRKPMILAPAMNVQMWEHPLTDAHLNAIKDFGYTPEYHNLSVSSVFVVSPQEKTLACGDVGVGAMAQIDQIVKNINASLIWSFPLWQCNGIPTGNHPGAFGYQRRHDMHTGVDLYTNEREPVFAVERGVVVATIPFTGPQLGHSWWNNTDALLVSGASGVVCYGEIDAKHFQPGDEIKRGQPLGRVIPVIQKGRERPDIKGHSRSMLHIELYKDLYDELKRGVWEGWKIGSPQPDKILNPTDRLLEANMRQANRCSVLTTEKG